MKPKPSKNRLLWVDTLRGFAIVLMIIFHFCYDLRYFGYVDWDVPNGSNWWPFRYLILTLFVFTVGISLHLGHGDGFKKKSFFNRLLRLSIAALAVSLISLFLFPNSWIYFGILHFIAVASLLGLPLARFPKVALLLGIILLVGYWTSLLESIWPFSFFSSLLPVNTEDFVPLFPWLGIMYLGIGTAAIFPVSKADISPVKPVKFLAAMGRHGLIIYLVHQPILFLGFYLVNAL